MSDPVTLGDTSHFWRIVALRNDCQLPFRKTTEWPVPSLEKVEKHRDQWSNAGEQADNVAQYLQDCLDRLSDGWKGKGAKAFTKKVDQVIYFARKLAYQCDSDKYSDPPPPEDDQGSSSGPQAPTETSGSGYVQIWGEILEKLRDAKNEEKNPTYPWCIEQYTMEAYPRDWNPGLAYYFLKNGEEIEIPGHGDCVNEADLWSEYNKIWGGSSPDDLVPTHLVDQVTEDRSGSQVTENADGQAFYHNAFFPADDKHYEELFVHLKLNKTEAATSRDTIATLLEQYAAVSEEPDPPEAPQLFSDASEKGAGQGSSGAGQGSSGGAPGGGGGPMGGGPSTPTTGEGPETDEMGGPDRDQDSGTPRPRDTNDQQDTLDRRGPGTPGPGDSPGPGSPEPRRGPGDNTGFPGPDRDTGTETARTGGGGPGTISGGPGGGSGGTIGGGGMSGGGAGGAGIAPGMAGGAGAGGAGAGGAGAGGMGAGRTGGMGGGMGMMPMMGGGGMGAGGEGGDEGDRDTWLDEDEDVWGTGGDAPPPVLGGSL